MIDKKNNWPSRVTFSAFGNYKCRFMARFYKFSTIPFATTCKGSAPKVDYLAFYLAYSCGFHFCLASLAP